MTELDNIELTENFSLHEALHSKKASKLGIDNTPSATELAAITRTAVGMERVRAACDNKVVSISSWFRCLLLNRAIGSKDTSQHPKGEAVDFNIFKFGSPRKVCERIVRYQAIIRFDQLILENGWVHISFVNPAVRAPRGEVLTITPDGKAHPGLVHYK